MAAKAPESSQEAEQKADTGDAAQSGDTGDAKQGSIRTLAPLNFVLADVQNGMGPYVTLFLQSSMGWNPAQIGAVVAAGNVAQVIAQTPAGALIDQLKQKRELLALGSALISLGCLGIVLKTVFPLVLVSQSLIGIAGALFPPGIAAITLGLVGRAKMDRQTGKNQAFNAAGNMTAAALIGAIGYFLGLHWMFYLIVLLSAAAIFFVFRIKAGDIDYALARGADDGDGKQEKTEEQGKAGQEGAGWEGVKDAMKGQWGGLRALVKDRRVLVFLVSAVLFHFANAAMVPLVTEMLAKGRSGKVAVLYTSGYMVASQFVFVIVAALAGRLAGSIGRKPLFLFGFAALAARGVLYTLSQHPLFLIGVQCMDGLGAGIFGVVSVLIIADMTKGTGRFNLAQGAIASAVGIGAFLSNSVSGLIAKHAGHNVAFLTLAAIAACGLAFFWVFMPETRDAGEDADGKDGSKRAGSKDGSKAQA